ncbi:hypothetical protein EKO04_011413 [Ascochyta lentis]|uniref:Uncharacterized protein n=1 Tax=Ascochyta lentis TaxID=205686 RepID=A0A8H7IU26_9PLEO|nr:hypothetical protein EKO04_011413 [Ascochyta lentis]
MSLKDFFRWLSSLWPCKRSVNSTNTASPSSSPTAAATASASPDPAATSLPPSRDQAHLFPNSSGSPPDMDTRFTMPEAGHNQAARDSWSIQSSESGCPDCGYGYRGYP